MWCIRYRKKNKLLMKLLERFHYIDLIPQQPLLTSHWFQAQSNLFRATALDLFVLLEIKAALVELLRVNQFGSWT